MVSEQDVRDLQEQIDRHPSGDTRSLGTALDALLEVHEDATALGVDPSGHPDWEQAQEDVKAAVAETWALVDGMVDRTDVLEDTEGNTLATLPNPPLQRDENDSTAPPSQGGS